MNSPYDDLPLGKATDYVDRYDPGQLRSISRTLGREALGLPAQSALPFAGEDVWNAYELSWLEPDGRPRVAVGRLRIPCESPSIVESKSLKLYLNSLNMTVFADVAQVRDTLIQDLTRCVGAPVGVEVLAPEQWPETSRPAKGICIDTVPLPGMGADGQGDNLLRQGGGLLEERIYSHLLRSRCPVTGQPDWASLEICYRGRAIDHSALLAYIVSYRNHQGFHEQCIERVFLDIMARCRPEALAVTGCFLRRGGIDINPRRCHNLPLEHWYRWTRQ